MATSKQNAKPNTVTLHGREFTLAEPDFGIVLRLLNVIGDVGLRAEAKVRNAIMDPTDMSLIFGLLAAMHLDDALRLGSAALQFPTEEEGVAWLQEHGVKITPIVQALLINVSLSTDLVAALENFTSGITGKVATLLPGVPTPSP
ncbi:MAG: hypothetical protein JXA21_12325 [Anaerolineae bacterium]|nr:hypothetical protein [Anaerolineae bacterium]